MNKVYFFRVTHVVKMLKLIYIPKCRQSTLTRRGMFKTLSSKDIEYFENFLQPTGIVNQPEDLAIYNTDWLKSHRGIFYSEVINSVLIGYRNHWLVTAELSLTRYIEIVDWYNSIIVDKFH